VTGAKATSGYGTPFDQLTSINLTRLFLVLKKNNLLPNCRNAISKH
jgi:hypothetical protein